MFTSSRTIGQPLLNKDGLILEGVSRAIEEIHSMFTQAADTVNTQDIEIVSYTDASDQSETETTKIGFPTDIARLLADNHSAVQDVIQMIKEMLQSSLPASIEDQKKYTRLQTWFISLVADRFRCLTLFHMRLKTDIQAFEKVRLLNKHPTLFTKDQFPPASFCLPREDTLQEWADAEKRFRGLFETAYTKQADFIAALRELAPSLPADPQRLLLQSDTQTLRERANFRAGPRALRDAALHAYESYVDRDAYDSDATDEEQRTPWREGMQRCAVDPPDPPEHWLDWSSYRWCPVTRRCVGKYCMTCVFMVPRSMRAVAGRVFGDPPHRDVVHEVANCLVVETEVRDAMCQGRIAFAPTKTVLEDGEIPEYRVVIIDTTILEDTFCSTPWKVRPETKLPLVVANNDHTASVLLFDCAPVLDISPIPDHCLMPCQSSKPAFGRGHTLILDTGYCPARQAAISNRIPAGTQILVLPVHHGSVPHPEEEQGLLVRKIPGPLAASAPLGEPGPVDQPRRHAATHHEAPLPAPAALPARRRHVRRPRRRPRRPGRPPGGRVRRERRGVGVLGALWRSHLERRRVVGDHGPSRRRPQVGSEGRGRAD
jgi:hypothetical protein